MISEAKTAREITLETLNDVSCTPSDYDFKKCVEEIYDAVRQEVLLDELPGLLTTLLELQKALQEAIERRAQAPLRGEEIT